MAIVRTEDGFDLIVGGRSILRQRPDCPCFFLGRSSANVTQSRGNFAFEDRQSARLPLTSVTASRLATGWQFDLAAFPQTPALLRVEIDDREPDPVLRLTLFDTSYNRFWARIQADGDEHVWGAGEQFSYFDLRGRRYPLWSSMPGVGRDKRSPVTFQADATGAGGDYWATYYPQPTYLSSKRYALHVDSSAYGVFDFRDPTYHELEFWQLPRQIELFSRAHFVDLVSCLSDRFGRQPALPDWVMQGAIIGLKGGEASFARFAKIRQSGAAVSALWCEDWCGERVTSFGRRVFWDWQWSDQRYPDHAAALAALARDGVRFLGYINPYLATDGRLYAEAAAQGFLVHRRDGGIYNLDFGEFSAGMVDFTLPAAQAWYADHVIGGKMIDGGLSGWMADFGEYLPTDAVLANGGDPMLWHNQWPVLWAETNAHAIAAKGRTGDVLFFMRSGYTGSQRFCPLLWAGDQMVDFSRHAGIGNPICGALSSGLLGNAYHHSDIGGYTSLFGVVRSAELLMRWAEMAAFTPVMRTHVGNRPDDNLQIDQDPDVLQHFARMTRIYRHLYPYLKSLVADAVERGLPFQRPLFLHFEDDPKIYAEQRAYLFGPDLLVAPVIEAGRQTWRCTLPTGVRWTHLWSGKVFEGGTEAEVAAPFGQPPVWIREGSRWTTLFEAVRKI